MSHPDHAQGPGFAPGTRRRVVNIRSDQVETLPRVILRAIGALVVLTVAAVGYARWTGMPPSSQPPVQAEAQSAMLVITSQGLSAVTVADAATGEVRMVLSGESAGFIAGVQRSYARQRMLAGVPEDAPVRVVRWEDGRMSLIDPVTGWRAEALGFGSANEEAFARLLD